MADAADHLMNRALLRRRLLAWYRHNRRDLPWRRRTGDPYAVWLSEIMLQQTQVASVIPYFESFLERYPTVADLAGAERGEVLRLWAGLGYYRRAHQMHETAQRITRDHAGCFPESVAELQTLPGVGRYTAGAIASIAFGRRAPILDGNVKRVLARVTASLAPPDHPDELRRLWTLAETLLPRRGSGEFNQALMDLGARVCTPRQPDCAACPLADQCAARQRGLTAQIPRPKARATVLPVRLICLVVSAGNHILTTQRPDHGLWSGTTALPAAEQEGRADPQRLVPTLLPAAVCRRIQSWSALGEIHHRLTHRDVTVEVHTAVIARVRVAAPFRWISDGETSTLPTVFRKALTLAQTTTASARPVSRRRSTSS